MEIDKNKILLAGALRRLFRNRFLVRNKNEKWFQIIIDLKELIQKNLDSFLLQLEINENIGVIYLKAIDDSIEEQIQYQVGRNKILSPLASALLLKLRYERLQFMLNPTPEGVALISLDDIKEFLLPFDNSKMDSQFEKNYRKAIEDLLQLEILFETPSEGSFYEISPLCEILLSLDELQQKKLQMEAYFQHFKNKSSQEGLC